jgi:hypothetical protein
MVKILAALFFVSGMQFSYGAQVLEISSSLAKSRSFSLGGVTYSNPNPNPPVALKVSQSFPMHVDTGMYSSNNVGCHVKEISK